MRLDKFLCEAGLGTRSQVKSLLKQKTVSVNGKIIVSADSKVDEIQDIICYQGKRVSYQQFVYYMMNKPAGVVSATQDSRDRTVLDLLRPEDRKAGVFPAGRLDKDTVGFLLLTNDGDLAHRLLSPRKHVTKTYEVTLAHSINEEQIKALESGLDIGEDKLTAPAKVKVINDTLIHLTIHEGKFHQVKRMLQAVDNQVTALKRITFGGLTLDESLKPGEYRTLSESEVQILNEA